MAKIEKQFSKLLIPFIHEGENYGDVQTPDGVPIWNKTQLFTNHLYDHIIRKQADGGILKAYKMNESARSAFLLPGANSAMMLSARGRESKISVKLKGVSLYVFETGVGFLELDWEYGTKEVSDFLDANYFLSELKSKENILQIRTGADSSRELAVADLVADIFKTLKGAKGFDRNQALSFYDLKPHLYCAVLLDKQDADSEELLSHASHNFKTSYKTVAAEGYRPFENSAWCGTDSGMVSISHLTGDKGPDEFFSTQFLKSAHDNYFYLYLLILNQKYTLQRRIGEIAQIDAQQSEDEATLRKRTSALSGLIAAARSYDTRCKFSCPSPLAHINSFYTYARSCLHVDCFEEELEDKLGALSQILEAKRKELDGYREYSRTKLLLFVFIIAQLIGSVTMFATSCDIVLKLTGLSVFKTPALLAIPVTLTVLFFISVGIQVVLKIREILSLRKRYKKVFSRID